MRTGRPSRSGHPTKGINVRVPIYLLTAASTEGLNLSDFLTCELKRRYDPQLASAEELSQDLIFSTIMDNWSDFITYIRLNRPRGSLSDLSPPHFAMEDKTFDPFMDKIRIETPGFPRVTKGWIRKNWRVIVEMAVTRHLIVDPVIHERFNVPKGHKPSSSALGVKGRFKDGDIVLNENGGTE